MKFIKIFCLPIALILGLFMTYIGYNSYYITFVATPGESMACLRLGIYITLASIALLILFSKRKPSENESSSPNILTIFGITCGLLVFPVAFEIIYQTTTGKAFFITGQLENQELHEAVNINDVLQLESLLKQGYPVDVVDEMGSTALFLAVSQDSLPMAEVLLYNKSPINTANFKGLTPLMIAVFNNNLNMTKLLLSHGADVNTTIGEGETMLYHAVMEGKLEMAKILLANKADVNAAENEGWTPLMWAVAEQGPEMVQLLLDHGANVNLTTKSGHTLQDFLEKNPSKDKIIHLLQ